MKQNCSAVKFIPGYEITIKNIPKKTQNKGFLKKNKSYKSLQVRDTKFYK